jgi:hypothetical protein
MRELTKEQKKLLDAWFEENKDKVGLFFTIDNCPEFTVELLWQLEAINNTEILISNINSYLSDRAMENA